MRNNYPELFTQTSERFKESFEEFKGKTKFKKIKNNSHS